MRHAGVCGGVGLGVPEVSGALLGGTLMLDQERSRIRGWTSMLALRLCCEISGNALAGRFSRGARRRPLCVRAWLLLS